MKKFMLMLLAMCLVLSACSGNKEEAVKDEAAVNVAEESKAVETEEPAQTEETEFVLCQQWQNVMTGDMYAINEDGTFMYGENGGKYEYDAENNLVKLIHSWGTESYEIFEEGGVWKLRYLEYVYVPSNVYEAQHELAVGNAKVALLEGNTVVMAGADNMLSCGLTYTLDSVVANEDENTFVLTFNCGNGTDEYCADFENIKVTWASGNLGCMFDVSLEGSGTVSANSKGTIGVIVKAKNRTLAELKQDETDTFGYLCIEFKTPKIKAYISANTLFGIE